MSLLRDTTNPNPLVLNWIPPATDTWNFTTEACAAATNWAGTFITAISISESEGNHPVPISVSVEYLYTILPSEYRQNTSNTSLAAWYYNQHNENIDDTQFEDFWHDFEWNFPVSYSCSAQLCRKIGWKEDPDLAGVGMLISYYIVAILTTIYYVLLLAAGRYQENESENDHNTIASLLACGVHEEEKHKRDREDQSLRTRILRAFRKTVNNFLLADLIFTVGMLGAALWRFHSASSHQEIPYSTFNMLVSFFMSCFSVLSCLVLQAVAKPKTTEPQDRHFYRWKLALPWIVIIPMVVALFALHLRDYLTIVGNPSAESIEKITRDSEFAEWVWLSICDPQQTRKIVEVVLYIGLALLCINAVWFSVALIYRVFRLWRRERTKRKGTTNINKSGREWLAKAYRYTRRFDGAVCAVVMWAFLVLFHIYRNSSHETAVDSDGGSKDWSFGQILALAAWAPTLVDLFNEICLHPLVDKYHDEKRQREMEHGKSKLSGGDRFATDQTV